MDTFTFTPAADGDPEAIAAVQARLAKLAPSCVRCGHKLAKRDLASRVCSDVDVCRIRRSGCSVAGYASQRAYFRKHGSPFVNRARVATPAAEPPTAAPLHETHRGAAYAAAAFAEPRAARVAARHEQDIATLQATASDAFCGPEQAPEPVTPPEPAEPVTRPQTAVQALADGAVRRLVEPARVAAARSRLRALGC